jgi:hypothetical protein
MSTFTPEQHPYRRAFDCVQFEEGEHFRGCLCPCWVENIPHKIAGKPMQFMRGCTLHMIPFYSANSVIAAEQVTDVIDGKDGLRHDVQIMVDKVRELESKVDNSLVALGSIVAQPLYQLVEALRSLPLPANSNPIEIGTLALAEITAARQAQQVLSENNRTTESRVISGNGSGDGGDVSGVP